MIAAMTGKLVATGAMVGALAFASVAGDGGAFHARAYPYPHVGACPLFPRSNAWNRPVLNAPRHPYSRYYIASMLRRGDRFLHPDFGGDGRYGIPYRVVPATQRRWPIGFTDFGDESDPGPYPIPLNAPIENGSDRHVLVVQNGFCRLYELFDARPVPGRGWLAASGAVFDLRSNRVRPYGWTSADAAGLPILAGLVRYEEARLGRIRHALRFTAAQTQRGFIHPARHFASDSTDPRLPPMGLRLRLRRGFPHWRYRGTARAVLVALKVYGMILADNGSDWFITGARDPRWNDADLNQLKTVPGAAFEVVYSGRIRR